MRLTLETVTNPKRWTHIEVLQWLRTEWPAAKDLFLEEDWKYITGSALLGLSPAALQELLPSDKRLCLAIHAAIQTVQRVSDGTSRARF
jgi:hypothetical protein